MPDELTPQQQRQQTAADYAAQFDVEQPEPPLPEIHEEAALSRTPPPRNADGTFRKPHPGRLLSIAAELGFEPDDIAGMETAELQRAVDYTVKSVLRQRRDESQRQQFLRNSVDQNLANQAPIPVPSAPTPDEQDALSGVDLSVYDEGLQTVMKRLAAENRKLREQVGQVPELAQRVVSREKMTNSDIVDEAFASLAGHAPRFGEGTVAEISADELYRRNVILGMAGVDMSKPMSARQTKAAILKAVETMYGKATQEPAAPPQQTYGVPVAGPKVGKRPGAQPTQEEWEELTVARPTQRQPQPEPNGRQKAIRSVSRIMEAQNKESNNDANGSVEPEDFLEG